VKTSEKFDYLLRDHFSALATSPLASNPAPISYSSPKTATLIGVPTNTFPFAIIGVMNLFPANWSRLPDAWFEL
jgi:hypothetical protein